MNILTSGWMYNVTANPASDAAARPKTGLPA